MVMVVVAMDGYHCGPGFDWPHQNANTCLCAIPTDITLYGVLCMRP